MNEDAKLLTSIKQALPELDALLAQANDKWVYEDLVYRFYHQSFKVFDLQEHTLRIVSALQELAPYLPLNEWFMEIVKQGTGRAFDWIHTNDRWAEETRPIVEAFFHAHFFLEMVCKYGKQLSEAPDSLPSGWAAVLYLYRIR